MKMTIVRTMTAALVTTVLLGACSQQDELPTAATTSGPETPIFLTVGTGGTADADVEWTATAGATRAGTTIQGAQFDANERLWVYFANGVRVDKKTYDCGTVLKTTDAAGTTEVVTPAEQPYFIETKTSTTAYVYYPYTEDASKRVTEDTEEFTVEANQNEDEAYKKSDLMWGKATITRSKDSNQTSNTTTGSQEAKSSVTMNHLLAKLTFTVQPTGLTVKAVRIVGGRKNCKVTTTESGTSNPVDLIYREITSVTANDAPTNVDQLTPSHYVTAWQGTATANFTASCILPPQAYTAGANFVQVVTDMGIINYRVPTTATQDNRTTVAGKNHTITLPVQAAFVNQTVDMAPWKAYAWTAGTDYSEAKQVITFSASAGSRAAYKFNMIRVKADPTVQSAITDDYFLGETECTNGLWYAIMGSKPALSTLPDHASTNGEGQRRDGDEYPVSFVNYSQITAFISALNTATSATRPKGYVFALPTVAQWQFAAYDRKKSDTYTYTYCGSSTLDDVAWYSEINSDNYSDNAYGTTHPVGTKKPTALGFYDMSGNVQEWTATTSGDNATFCCGGYRNEAIYQKPGYTSSLAKTSAKNDTGFRLALVRGSVTLSEAQIGDIVGSDGKAYPSLSAMPTGVTAEAVVCQRVGSGGKAIAIHDAPGLMQWETPEGAHPAQEGVSTYAAAHPVTGGTWSLPSFTDWYLMAYYLAVNQGNYTEFPSTREGCEGYNERVITFETISNVSTVAGGEPMIDNFYWSSTEDDYNSFASGKAIMTVKHDTEIAYISDINRWFYVYPYMGRRNSHPARYMLTF